MCLKWEALLAEGERPRAFGSMVFWVVCSSRRTGGRRYEADAILGALGEHASCARKGWQLGSAKDDRARSERFGREDSARAAGWAAAAQQVEAGAVTAVSSTQC